MLELVAMKCIIKDNYDSLLGKFDIDKMKMQFEIMK